MRKNGRGWRSLRTAMAVGAVVAVVDVAIAVPAFANAANPNPDTIGTTTVNPDGTVTANVSGTWSWPGQNCEGRYGEGYAIDWWGVSSSQTPSPSFSLTNATEVATPGSTTTGTISPAGAIAIGNGPNPSGGYFHVAQYYAGEVVNSPSTCTDTTINGQPGSEGAWSATATYPNAADVPAAVCVNMYDEHGNEGQSSGNPNDFSPSQDNDNSIQTNAFDPSDGYCVKLVPGTPTPNGAVGALGLSAGLALVGGGVVVWRRRRGAHAVEA